MKEHPEGTSPGERLRTERRRQNLTQSALAKQVGVDEKTIQRWEDNEAVPREYNLITLGRVLGHGVVAAMGFPKIQSKAPETAEHADQPFRQQELPFPAIWNVPFERPPLFTGREQILQRLADSLLTHESMVPTQTLTGLGGVGKTQIALEYCYRHRSHYQAVLWVTADSPEALTRSLREIATLLKLPESTATEQQPVLNALREWMRKHASWLLVLDNLEDMGMAREILPPARRGHVLLTTRTQITGNYPKIDVQVMSADEGALFLLWKANVLAPGANLEQAEAIERETARRLARTLGGLPLALDQAGAYIQETNCGFAGYLDQYRQKRADLLRRRGPFSDAYPASVATTWSLSFERIEQTNAAAADLLRASAFLSPDAIPEGLFVTGARELGPAFQGLAQGTMGLDEIVTVILRYSLIRRHSREKTLSIHRLVQAVLVDDMPGETQRLWAERVVKAVRGELVGRAYEDPPNPQYALQAYACLQLVLKWQFAFLQAAQVMCAAGRYLYHDGYYQQAGEQCFKALTLFQALPEATEQDRYLCLTILVLLKIDSGDFSAADLFAHQLLAQSERAFGPTHPLTAHCCYYLATIAMRRGLLDQAEPLLMRALTIMKASPVPQQLILDMQVGLAKLRSHQGRKTEAETLYRETLASMKHIYGPEHPRVADVLTEWAMHASTQGEPAVAEARRQEATAIYTQTSDPDHPDLLQALAGSSIDYLRQRRYVEADDYYERAMSIWKKKLLVSAPEQELPEEMPIRFQRSAARLQPMLQILDAAGAQRRGETLATLSLRLANACLKQGYPGNALDLFWHALEVAEQIRGKRDPVTVLCLGNLARFCRQQKEHGLAEFLYERALYFAAEVLRWKPEGTLHIFSNYIQFLRETGRESFAAELESKLKILESQMNSKGNERTRQDLL